VCVPIVTAAESEIDVADGLERAVCIYVRAIADERVRASKCFAQMTMTPMPPPPPPAPTSRLAALTASLLKRRVRQGGTNGAEAAPDKSSLEQYNQEAAAQRGQQLDFLDELAESNVQLRDLLGGIKNKIVEGRRLWQRSAEHVSHKLEDNVLASTAFGKAPIVGVTMSECQALCAAISNATLGTCKAVAFARQNGADSLDLTLWQCWLLQSIGGCSAGSFAGAVFNRRSTDGCTEPTEADNPLCIQLASSRTDLRVLDFASSESACRAGRGRPLLANPRTHLEAFSMLGYARERGITSFFSARPYSATSIVKMPWSGADGHDLEIPAGDRRCVLVSTIDSDTHGYMYAELKPCSARLADGLICESAQAAPPPPPGDTSNYPPPPPPPPPIGVTASMRWFVRREIVPRTEAICLAGLTDNDIAVLCTAFATELAKSAKAGTLSSFQPLCQPVCFHSCGGASEQDRDGFENCRDPACADTSCSEFLLRFASQN
jgi:hypothetical protein